MSSIEFKFEIEFECPKCGLENCESFVQTDKSETHDLYCYECDKSYSVEINIEEN